MCLKKELSSLHYELQFCAFYLDPQINTVEYLFFCDTMSDDAWPSKQRTGQTSELHVYTVHWVNKSSPVQLIN